MKAACISFKEVKGFGYRFDAPVHLSEGVSAKRLMQSCPYKLLTIGDVSERVWHAGRWRRVYVNNPNTGIVLLGSSAILKSDLSKEKMISVKYTEDKEDKALKKGWTLISCSGTIGNCAFANAQHAEKLASQHVIRVSPNNILREGVIYAFLASKYGYSMLTQGTFGSVIQHIEPENVKEIPIPQFPDSFQKEVDDLMQESARLREEAMDALEEAQELIDDKFSRCSVNKENSVSIKSIINSHNTRFEGQYYTSKNRSIYDYIVSHCEYKPLKELTDKIFRPGIFKREYVQNGVTFLGGADIMMAIPDSDKKLSFKQVERIPELLVKRGWILVTCGGTIGNTVCIDSQLAQCAISQHVMRVVPKEDTLKGYLYAFLSSNTGHMLINLYTAGSVIPQIEAHHLERVPVPMMEKELMVYINSLVETYISNLENSKDKEKQAISMVEQEIERWNK